MEKYCDKLMELKKKKEFEKVQILDNLTDAKFEWNYPKIQTYESKSNLIFAQLHMITLIIENMKLRCPVDMWTEDNCESNCKEIYENTIKIMK